MRVAVNWLVGEDLGSAVHLRLNVVYGGFSGRMQCHQGAGNGSENASVSGL